MNYDGTSAQQINVVLPSGLTVNNGVPVLLSPDQKTIFFLVQWIDNSNTSINGLGYYSCGIDGSNAKLISPASTTTISLEVAY